MRFDYTKGKKARYVVSLYGWNIEDHYYFNNYKEAGEMYKQLLKKHKDEVATCLGIYDLDKDIRKAFAKF